jgi:PAP2 superfamily
MTRRSWIFLPSVVAIAATATVVVWTQSAATRFERFWGERHSYPPDPLATVQLRQHREPPGAVDQVRHWNKIAIDMSGLDHTPVQPGENREFGHQLGPGRASRAIAIAHIAIFDAVNAIADDYESFTGLRDAPPGTSMDAAIAQAAHDTLVALFPSQKPQCDEKLSADLARIRDGDGKEEGIRLGRRAAREILERVEDDGSSHPEPLMGIDFHPSDRPGKWRQDPISLIPVALGAHWGYIRPLVIRSARAFRAPPPPPMKSRDYAEAFNEVKRLGGDGIVTPTERTDEQTLIGIYWAYDGTPSLCAPPRLYNQIAMTIADQMGTDAVELARLLALVNVAMSDAGIAIWESKYFYQFWRPVTGIREADRGTGPTGRGDGNPRTEGDPTFSPLGAPASNLQGPNFTPPFPAYPSGHAGFGGALFEMLRNFYGRDNIRFTFISDELNGETRDNNGVVRPLVERTFSSLSQAEEENGQSRIYLGIHWSFDKTEGIAQGRRIADYVFRNAFRPRNRNR